MHDGRMVPVRPGRRARRTCAAWCASAADLGRSRSAPCASTPGAPARDGPSQGSSITNQAEEHAFENRFAHLLFEGMSPDDLSDQAAKVNTWRNIPARCRPNIADIIIEIEQRTTGGSECTCDNCQHCNLRYQTWLEFHYLFQIIMRNKERLEPEKDAGPKVDYSRASATS